MKLLLSLLLGFFLACLSPIQAAAQRVYGIGTLISDDLFVPAVDGFKKKMAELGYTEGKNIKYDSHNAKANQDALRKLAQALVRAKPDLIVTSSTSATVPVAKLTVGSDLPVVFLSAGNPLEFVKSYASSGNNLTGISTAALDLTPKRLELLKEMVPSARRIASLNNPKGVNYQEHRAGVREAVNRLGFTLRELDVTNSDEVKQVAAALTRQAVDAIIMQPDYMITKNIDVVVKQSIKEKLPLVVTPDAGVRSGGLASYGHDGFELGQQGATLVDRILKGARPRDLPIEQPVKLKLVINLKTAKAIGLKISKELLLRADEVIE